MKWITSAGLAALFCATAQAGEFAARAEVLEVEPVYRSSESAPVCRYPAAPAQAGLGAVLRWDLGLEPLECTPARAERELEGYRVTYEWNGRRFTELMDEDPGAFVPVRVRVH